MEGAHWLIAVPSLDAHVSLLHDRPGMCIEATPLRACVVALHTIAQHAFCLIKRNTDQQLFYSRDVFASSMFLYLLRRCQILTRCRPNVEDLKGKVNALEETIAKAKARQDEIRKELDGRRRGGNDTESNEIRKQLQALRNEFQQVLVRLTNVPLCAGRHAALKYQARVSSAIATHTHVANF